MPRMHPMAETETNRVGRFRALMDFHAVDGMALRRQYPKICMVGHYNKIAMSLGESAMRAEFERLAPLTRTGGFISRASIIRLRPECRLASIARTSRCSKSTATFRLRIRQNPFDKRGTPRLSSS